MTSCFKCKEETWKTTTGLCSECEPTYEKKFHALCEENGIKINREYGSQYLTTKYWFYLGIHSHVSLTAKRTLTVF